VVRAVSAAQYPIAIVVSCADSRVSPELLFDAAPKSDDAPLRWRGLYLVASSDGANPGAFVVDLFQRFLAADQPLARPRG